jgi:hypothetical protein
VGFGEIEGRISHQWVVFDSLISTAFLLGRVWISDLVMRWCLTSSFPLPQPTDLRQPKGEDLLYFLLCQTQDPLEPTCSPASHLSDISQDPPDPRQPASPLVSPLLLDSTRSPAFPGRPPASNTKEERGRGTGKRRRKKLALSNLRKINKNMKNNKRREKSTQLKRRGFLKLV